MATVEIELTDAELVTLTATIGSCVLMVMERHLPPKSALRSRIAKVEDAIKSLAQLNACKLDDRLFDAGIHAWSSAIERLQKELTSKPQLTRLPNGRMARKEMAA